MQTAFAQQPTTPSSTACYSPHNSSPLASSASTTLNATSRRRSQYKATAHQEPRTPTPGRRRSSGIAYPLPALVLQPQQEQDTQKSFLREQFKKQCIERARKARALKVENKRRASLSSCSSEPGSSDCEMGDEEEDEDETPDEEFLSRVMAASARKERHQYRLWYAQDVGSSFDPDMEDHAQWEAELQETLVETTPDDLDQEEFAAYVEELAGGNDELAGLDLDEIFSLSDLDEDMEMS